jgi:hypothetical protein
MTRHADSPVNLHTPGDLIAFISYGLGFHPHLSLVAVLSKAADTVHSLIRLDLPEDAADISGCAEHLVLHAGRSGFTAAGLVGYGPAQLVTPVVEAVSEAFARAGVAVIGALRVEQNRYWSYTCPCGYSDCSPSDGVPYDPATSSIAAAAVVAGAVALPDRKSFEATLAPVAGEVRTRIEAATRTACDRARTLLPFAQGQYWYAEGEQQIMHALEQTRAGNELSPATTAWLGVLLTAKPIRDRAITLLGSYDDSVHLRLWTTVTQMVDEAFAAAPAVLVALTALRTGNGPLTNIAIERSLKANPHNTLAELLQATLRSGIPIPELAAEDWATSAPAIAADVERDPRSARPALPREW